MPANGEPGPDATQLLQRLSNGQSEAGDELLQLLYEELHGMAQARMARERPDHTLQPTVLVHDVWMRLAGQQRAEWKNRSQFLAVAATAMRRLLVNHARDRVAGKRGGDRKQSLHLSLAGAISVDPAESDVDLLALDEALVELAGREPEWARVVDLRFFAGLSVDETGEALGLSPRTVDRRWLMARSWLHARIGTEPGSTG